MVRYRAVVSYLGSAYKGFEKQKQLPTIQGKIEDALCLLLATPTAIHGAGRTDAGVHARGQCFSFSSKESLSDIEAFRYALNRLLPSDIVVLSLQKASDDFDARHSSSGKIYSYSFHLGQRDPFAVTEYQQEYPHFDVALFKEAVALYRGRHDFKNFTTKPADKDNFIRTILSLEVFELANGHYRVVLKANGFMTYMVRIMIGLAFKVALKKITLEEETALFHTEERKIISYKAPAEGLCLEEVLYE